MNTRTLVIGAGAVLLGGIGFAVVLDQVYLHGLEQTSLLFLTVPTLLGVVAAVLPLPIHVIWRALGFVTLCLLESFLFFGEGVICVLMAAPLFYGCAVFAAVAVDLVSNAMKGQRVIAVAALPLFTLLVGPRVPAEPARVEVSVVVDATVEEVETRFGAPRDPAVGLPWTLGLFPQPVETRGEGLEVGDRRAVYFAGGEGKPGWFETEVVERWPDGVAMELVRDDSHLAHWLAWDRDEIRWRPVDGGTEVTWAVEYRNELAPDAYFGPAEAWTMRVALDHLIRTHTAPL